MYRTGEDRGLVFIPKDVYLREMEKNEEFTANDAEFSEMYDYGDAQVAARKILRNLKEFDDGDGTVESAERKARQLLERYQSTRNRDLTFSTVEDLEIEKMKLSKRLAAVEYALHQKSNNRSKPPPHKAAAIYWGRLRTALRFTFLLRYLVRRRRWGY
eukprot:TRINITY_DN29027_c0_g1_i1.p1 TRINITY_DN29027_c0_g1~~TRINITY_DN29027_c0_g1_i1.p1  ORF type:complete len:158 (+),score=31.91 TRINITY_DN29027_c0_g1_i1:59-532(+)